MSILPHPTEYDIYIYYHTNTHTHTKIKQLDTNHSLKT